MACCSLDAPSGFRQLDEKKLNGGILMLAALKRAPGCTI